MNRDSRLIEVRRNVLARNDVAARELRQQFRTTGTFVVSLISSPGAGKTLFLEKTLALLQGHSRVAALVGDLATENDCARLARSGVPVRQIVTGTVCHLEAEMVRNSLRGWSLGELDFLFIENVGNLVCPASYDLGEDLRVVMMSVTEGEDKPLKYPPVFYGADLAIITKTDLAEVVEFDAEAAARNIEAVHPSLPRIQVSAKKGTGMPEWLQKLFSLAGINRMPTVQTASRQSAI